MAGFALFPRLPAEIRVRIWQMAVEPRTVEIRPNRGPYSALEYFVSSTPVPAVLHVCYEARTHASYQQAFALGSAPRYVWVNFQMDMISIGHTWFLELQGPDALLIRRLRFERENDEWFFHFESKEMMDVLRYMEEIHVVCKDGVGAWYEAWECLGFPCPRDKLRFLDKDTGEAFTGEDLERMEAELYGEDG
ncbi:hypothetical protein BJY00DRAFT_270963 [Aspergillus carlsbadensis]|nr:hypothetical protein BJY00DRAFT_270963 [Aspergillus carlsbadensis]